MYFENFDLENVVSPVNVDMLEALLRESQYDEEETRFLTHGFRFGFDIGFRGNIKNVRRTAPNLKLRVGSEVILWNKIMKEVKLKRYAGPFCEVPFPEFIQSPVGLVPKDSGRDTRLIFHLSYPRDGESINSCTPKDMTSVSYCDFADAVLRCLQEGISCSIAKSDMKSAFRNLGIKPEHWCLLILKAKSPLDGKIYYFVDKCLPFGAAISCSHLRRFSDCVAHLVKFRTQKTPVNYLDDYLFAALCKALCDWQVNVFLDICNSIAFPVSLEKTFWGQTTLVFLGLLIDTVHQFISIPVDKVQKAREMIHFILNKENKKVTVKHIQRVCGYLNFLCKCIVPGRAFIRRLYFCYNNNMKPHHHLRVNTEIREDLTMWGKFLEEPTVYCRPFMDFTKVLHATDIDWYTDASGVIGLGGYCKSQWFSQAWSSEFLAEKPSIQYQELFVVAVSVLLWARNFANQRICIFTDNKSVRDMLNLNTSGCRNCLVLIRFIVLESLTWNVRIFAKYVESKNNNFADALSRLQLNRFWYDAQKSEKEFEPEPCKIPELLWPVSKIWISKA